MIYKKKPFSSFAREGSSQLQPVLKLFPGCAISMSASLEHGPCTTKLAVCSARQSAETAIATWTAS